MADAINDGENPGSTDGMTNPFDYLDDIALWPPSDHVVLHEVLTKREEERARKWQPANIIEWVRQEPPKMNYLFEGVLPEGTIGTVAGTGGQGKTTFTLQLGVSLSTGKTIFPKFIPTAARPVMLFLGEDLKEVTRTRLWNVVRKFPLTEEEEVLLNRNLRLYCVPGEPLCEYVDGKLAATLAYTDMKCLINAVKPALVVIDPKSRWSGMNENNNNEATAFVRLLEELVAPHGGTMIITHHASKSGQKSANSATVRGASAFVDALRLVFLMVPEGESMGVPGDGILLSTPKSNVARKFPKPVKLRHCEEYGGILEEVEEVEDALDPAELARLLAAWLSENGPMNQSDVKIVREGKSRELHSFLESRCGSYKKLMPAVLVAGVEERLLVIEKVCTGGRPAVQVRAALPDEMVEGGVACETDEDDECDEDLPCEEEGEEAA